MIAISRKGKAAYYICLLVLVLGLAGNRDRDCITREYYNYPDYPELNNIAVNGEFQTACDAGEAYNGMVTSGPDLTLPAGSYEIDFHYRSEADGNRFEVVSDTEVNTENSLGCSFAAGELPLNDDGRYTAEFTLDNEVEHAQIKTYTTEGDLFIYGYTLHSVRPVNNDTWAMIVVVVCAFVLFRVFCMRSMKWEEEKGAWFEITDVDRLGTVLAVVLVGLIASLPCFTDFVTEGHDLDYHLTRIEGLKEALACGQFPVRINPEFANGAGMASPILYPELFLYFPAVLRLLGVSLILSYHLFAAVMNLACAWAGYIAFRKLTGKRTLGVLMSALYTLSLYRLNNLYMRAAVGEWTGMIFLPLVIYGMYALFYEEKEKWGWGVLAFTFCLQGHLLTTEMAIAFSCLFALVSWKQLKEKGRLVTVAKAAAVTVLVNLWYIAPFLYFYSQSMGVAAEQQPLGQYSLYPEQLFATFLYNRNMGEYLGTTAGEIPTTVGGILGIGILFYLYAAYVRRSLTEKEKKAGNLLLLFGLLSLYMTTCYFPWELLQKIRLVDILAGVLQFPMRILAASTLFLCGTGALGIYGILKGKVSGRGIVLTGTILAVAASAYTFDQYTEQNKTALADDADSYNKNLIYGGLLYYQGTDSNALLSREPVIMAQAERVSIHDLKKQGTTLSFTCENSSGEDVVLELPLYYYPGYRAWNSGEEVEIKAGNNGMAEIVASAGQSGEFLVCYREKAIFLVCDWITVITLAALAVQWLRKKER
ncbi:MAG: hypothetical protein GX234_07345 [Clostridiales bacterium]|nr:hypothetical protein [Clostridiales bacterium]